MPKKIDHDIRRKEIAQAAISVIGSHGIENVRLIDVARQANATTGSITHYFEDKDAVLLAALDQVSQGILELINTPLAADADVDDLIDYVSLVLPLDEDGHEAWRVWLAFFGRAIVTPGLLSINRNYYTEFHEGLVRIIHNMQKRRKVSATLDVTMIADAIITVVDGLGVRAALDPENWTAEKQTNQLRTMLLPLLRAS
ncbi:MAG: TetR family transcriptional regulator [Rhizobiales bacterium]|nr:TetR family transcriptional regulator [Hyphomicrobiales bacterium]